MSFFNFSNKPGSSTKKPAATKDKTLPKDYTPKRFGLKYDPPTIILEYMLQENGKLYHHKMKLTYMKENASNAEILDILKKKHVAYLSHERITDDQLIALIDKLKSTKKPLKELVLSNQTKATASSNLTNLNSKPEGAFSKLGKLEPLTKPGSQSFQSNQKPTSKAMAADDFYEEDFDLDEDLNKLDTDTLKQKKAKMDVLFSKNQKKPGDKDFQYDVQEDFNPKFANEWDLDDDEDIV